MEVTCEDLEQQTFADETFDLIVTQHVLEHDFRPDLVIKRLGGRCGLEVLMPTQCRFTTPSPRVIVLRNG